MNVIAIIIFVIYLPSKLQRKIKIITKERKNYERKNKTNRFNTLKKYKL